MALFGPKWPLSKGNHDTFALYDDIEQQTNYYLKNLLLTSPGENISDTSYGVGLRSFLFEMNSGASSDVLYYRISSQISSYIPYIRIEDLQIEGGSDTNNENLLSVRLNYSIENYSTQLFFELDMNPSTFIGFY